MDELYEHLRDDVFLREPVNSRIRQAPKETPKDEARPAPLKVELQTLRLNSDSQKVVLDTLRYIHGSEFQLKSAGLYKDKGSKMVNRYWMERGNLIVQGGCDYSLKDRDKSTTEDKFRIFALNKLESYCFHKPHCAEALDVAEGDIDKALQILYSKYYNVSPDQKISEDLSTKEVLEQRTDEKSVLESIYESAFVEKEQNRHWLVTVDLDYLVQLYIDTEKKNTSKHKENINYNNRNNNFKTKKKEVCRNFRKGACSFGLKCRFSHETAPRIEIENKNNEDHLKPTFQLEVRFPNGCCYPHEPPLLFFKTIPKGKIPELVCLKITRRLIEEAKLMAADAIPSIYSIVELLKNEDDIVHFIKFDTYNFPDMSDLLFPENDEEDMIKESRPSHFKRAQNNQTRATPNLEGLLKVDNEIARDYVRNQDRPEYKKMMETRRKLPAWNKRTEILNTINKSQVVVISGETGCGKSTQVPQYILDDWLWNLANGGEQKHVDIICTQPRRISAIGVADRVADERTERTGTTIGYQIRLESKSSSRTRLMFCTTGILLRRLASDPRLVGVSHVLVDEVHERSEESDFLLLVLRDLLRERRDLTLVLMSATLNANLFSKYFGDVPVLEIPGRTFPVDQYFLEDIMDMTNYVLEENSKFCRKVKKGDKSDLETELETCDLRLSVAPKDSIHDDNLGISQLAARFPGVSRLTCKNLYLMDTEKVNLELIEHVLEYIVEGDHDWPMEGSILVFLPGISEITSLYEQLTDSRTFGPKSNRFTLVPLHSSLTGEEQARVFAPARQGTRKIVLSTNIAETSVTIDDCVFVVDCGKMKEKRFDWNRNMESLDTVWVSRANARQRAGRAGRVRAGVCVRLLTSHRFQHHLLEQPVPEMHRVPLEQLLLRIKVLPLFDDMDCQKVLERTLEPPSAESVLSALGRLQDAGALDRSLALTPLGQHLAALPVDVRVGKLMLMGAIFCCVDSALTIAACLSYKSPFVAPFGKKDEADKKKRSFAVANSDQLTVLRAYNKWREAMSRGRGAGATFASENFLSMRSLVALGEIKHQLLGLLASIGFVPDLPGLTRKHANDQVLKLTGHELNINGENDKVLGAILCSSLYPNVVKVLTPEKSFQVSAGGAVPRQPRPDELRFKTRDDGFVALHPSSVNHTVAHYTSPYLAYQEKVKTSRVFIRDCCMVPQLPLVLFTGCDLAVELHNGTFVVSLGDGWIMFQVETHQVAEMLKSIRGELNSLLEEKIADPSLHLPHHDNGSRVIGAIIQLLSSN